MQHGLRVLTTDKHYLEVPQIITEYYQAISQDGVQHQSLNSRSIRKYCRREINSGEWMGSRLIPKRWEGQEQSEEPKRGTSQSETSLKAEASLHSRSSLARTGRAQWNSASARK